VHFEAFCEVRLFVIWGIFYLVSCLLSQFPRCHSKNGNVGSVLQFVSSSVCGRILKHIYYNLTATNTIAYECINVRIRAIDVSRQVCEAVSVCVSANCFRIILRVLFS